MNNWIQFVKKYQIENNIPYSQALVEARQHYYKLGGSFKSDFIKSIIYNPTVFNASKIKNKSDYIKSGKYYDKHEQLNDENENVLKFKKHVIDYNSNILKDMLKQNEDDKYKNKIVNSDLEKVENTIDMVNNYLNTGRKENFKTEKQLETFQSLINAIASYDYYPTPKKYSTKIYEDLTKWYDKEIKLISVLDIASGLLSLSIDFIKNEIKTYLIEMNPYFSSIIKPLANLRNVKLDTVDFFTLKEDYYFKKDIDVIVMNPPFAGSINGERINKIYLYFIMKAVDILINSRVNRYDNSSRFLYVICPKTYFKEVKEGDFTELNIPDTIVKKASNIFNIDYWNDYTPHIEFLGNVEGFRTIRKGKPISMNLIVGLYKFIIH